MATIESTTWSATHPAVHREKLPDDDGVVELALLRHPDYPFCATVAGTADLDTELREVADAYLERAGPLDPRLDHARKIARDRADTGFGWLPITWDERTGLSDPVGSWTVRRGSAVAEVDGTAVLMAANRVRVSGRIVVDGGGVGLRVVMHLDPPSSSQEVKVRVSGLSACRLGRATVPPDESMLRERVKLVAGTLDALRTYVGNALGLAGRTVWFNSLQPIGEARLSVSGTGAREWVEGGVTMQRGYLWQIDVGTIKDGAQGSRLHWAPPRLVEQSTAAEGAAHSPTPPPMLFLRDAASRDGVDTIESRRTTRDAELLNPWREPASVPPTLDGGDFVVMQSVLSDPKSKPDQPQTIDPAKLPLRSDHLAAAHAYRRGEELFDLLDELAIDRGAYFRFAKLPLRLRHRAWFPFRPDGRVVNAMVDLSGAPLPFYLSDQLGSRPELEVRFGVAELRHREVHEDDHGRLNAQSLGLAADPRLAWHEFGHVLAYAATGALEMHFAHSVGDALAAVLADPQSKLTEDRAWRGLTYPWLPMRRRHDRDARLGWCFCGGRNGMRGAPMRTPPLLRKGYTEEQMLSSALFRLYRSIGGDSHEAAIRERAARACAFLVVRALALAGPALLVTVRSADAFVSLLVDADIGSRARDSSGDAMGGTLHKVVRWAFEQQGLFATDVASERVDRIGEPPAVDLWIEDLRPGAARGGYEPVELGWDGSQPWHASPAAVRIDGTEVVVTVDNRGSLKAEDVDVRAWFAPANSGNLVWTALGQVNKDEILPKEPAELRLPLPTAAGPHHLLVEASCRDDRSNLDPESSLPCATGTPPSTRRQTLELVANDNNLGLRTLDFGSLN